MVLWQLVFSSPANVSKAPVILAIVLKLSCTSESSGEIFFCLSTLNIAYINSIRISGTCMHISIFPSFLDDSNVHPRLRTRPRSQQDFVSLLSDMESSPKAWLPSQGQQPAKIFSPVYRFPGSKCPMVCTIQLLLWVTCLGEAQTTQ